MKKFILTLANDIDTIDISFNVLDTDIAKRWATEIENNYPLYESTRFQGWYNQDLEYFSKAITEQVDIINSYQQYIDNSKPLTQDTLNYLHKFFEDMRGPIVKGNPFYNDAPLHVKNAIIKFNVLIHDCEHFLRDQQEPTIVGTYHNRPRIALQENDYEHFTFKWEYGTVYINYCEVGKTLLDVYKDRDELVGNENIKPLEYYSADFMIKFGINVPEDFYQQRLQDFQKWYSTTDYSFKHLSLGLIPVAKLSSSVSDLSTYTRIKQTCIQ